MTNYEKEKRYLAERRVLTWVMCFCTIIAMGLSILAFLGKERTKPVVITEEPVSYEEGVMQVRIFK